MTVQVKVDGCDDGTDFLMEMTEEEYKFLLRLIEANNAVADYHCKPKIRCYKVIIE